MNVELKSLEIIANLKTAAENKTGKTFGNLTGAVQELCDGYGSGSGDITISGHKVLLGSAIPDENGKINVNIGIKTAIFAVIWLDDVSVVPDYTDTSIVLSVTQTLYDNYSCIECVNRGNHRSYMKSSYGVDNNMLKGGVLYVSSNTNSNQSEFFVLVPHNYNYMVIYD